LTTKRSGTSRTTYPTGSGGEKKNREKIERKEKQQ